MSIFRNVVLLAASAGLMAGLFMAVLQITMTTPLILKAEFFENNRSAAQSADHHGTGGVTVSPTTPAAGNAANEKHGRAAHAHDDTAWAPADGVERTAYTVLANVVTAIGFALLLVVVSEFAGGLASWYQGVIWGFAGFAVFTLAPGLGLAPELPAMPAADLIARQTWWIATAAATAAGLALIVFPRQWVFAVLGVVLIIVPHIIGAPQPNDHSSPIPANLHHQFVVISTITSLLFWLVLGAACGALHSRLMVDDELPGTPVSA